jgi:hypothetical protein
MDRGGAIEGTGRRILAVEVFTFQVFHPLHFNQGRLLRAGHDLIWLLDSHQGETDSPDSIVVLLRLF